MTEVCGVDAPESLKKHVFPDHLHKSALGCPARNKPPSSGSVRILPGHRRGDACAESGSFVQWQIAMPYRISKSFEIESGHILSKHPDKCRFPHGHSRRVEIVLVADQLDANDMVCDFKALKQRIGAFIESWDHALCLNSKDPNLEFYQRTYGERIITFAGLDPTSEVMAKAIFDELNRKLREAAPAGESNVYQVPPGVRVERVRVTETSSSWAEYSES
jgi:6-pyruvoyltetrahydropterin/6-carboxytetrahydropterin synthase